MGVGAQARGQSASRPNVKPKPAVARLQALHDVDEALAYDLYEANEAVAQGMWPLARYPQVVFDVEQADHVDVWRVLHGQRDIPAWMSQAPEGV